MNAPGTIRVLSIPAGHPYVEALAPNQGWGPVLIEPDPVVDPTDPQRWWPHPALDAAWWDSHTADVVHVHFGFEHLSVAETRAFTRALQQRGIPLVLTVHDLDNPHLSSADDQADHRARLRVLIDAAAQVLTLSTAARDIIAADYGACAEVVAHPPIVSEHQRSLAQRARGRRSPVRHTDAHSAPAPGPQEPPSPAQQSQGLLASAVATAAALASATATHPRVTADAQPTVGVYLKSLRANVVSDPHFYLRLAHQLRTLATHRDHTPRLEVFAHRSQAGSALLGALAASAGAAGVDVILHDPLEDAELFASIATHRAVVLPYTRGTHSGWLRMCQDLGVPVAVPDCGCFVSQADGDPGVLGYRTGDGADAGRVAAVLLEGGDGSHPCGGAVPGPERPPAASAHASSDRRGTGVPPDPPGAIEQRVHPGGSYHRDLYLRLAARPSDARHPA